MRSCSGSGRSGQGAQSLLTPRSPCCCCKWLRITQCCWASKMGRCTVGTRWAATTGWTSTCSEVMCTSRNRDKLRWVLECYIRSSAIKQHLPDEIIYMVKGRRHQGPWPWWLQQQKGPGKGGCCARQDPRHRQRSAGKAERQANSEPPLCSPETEPASLGFCSHPQGRFSSLQVMSLFRTKRHRCRERTPPHPAPLRLQSVIFPLFC